MITWVNSSLIQWQKLIFQWLSVILLLFIFTSTDRTTTSIYTCSVACIHLYSCHSATLAFIALAACHLPLVSFIALSHHNWFWFWFWYTGTLHHNTTHLQWCQEAKKNNKTLTGAAKDVLTVGKHVLKWYGCACLNPCGAASLLILTLMLIEVGSI